MPRFINKQLIVNGDGSGTNTITSEVLDTSLSYGYCVQFVFSGGVPVGTARVQGSINGTSWTDITTIAVTATGLVADNKDAQYWPQIRVVYNGTSGVGVVLNCWLNTKGG